MESGKNNVDLLEGFLIIYFYLLEKNLNEEPCGLQEIRVQSEEANTDEFLKHFFQNYIKKNNSIKNTTIKKVSILNDNDESVIEVSQLLDIEITDVFLPDQLSPEQKAEITSQKKSVYTNPDLYLEISFKGKAVYRPVELKSTKDNKIPGSSVQQVSPHEWVIFVKRDTLKPIVSTGLYLYAITEKIQFPDRSPRPEVGFKALAEWNDRFRKEESNTLTIENNSDICITKLKLLEDWQDYLADSWLIIIQSKILFSKEKWFNTAIRKFAIKLLLYFESLSEFEKDELKERLNTSIKK